MIRVRWWDRQHDCNCHECKGVERVVKVLGDIVLALEDIAKNLKPPINKAVGGFISLGKPELK
jgi:hypothetical protein